MISRFLYYWSFLASAYLANLMFYWIVCRHCPPYAGNHLCLKQCGNRLKTSNLLASPSLFIFIGVSGFLRSTLSTLATNRRLVSAVRTVTPYYWARASADSLNCLKCLLFTAISQRCSFKSASVAAVCETIRVNDKLKACFWSLFLINGRKSRFVYVDGELFVSLELLHLLFVGGSGQTQLFVLSGKLCSHLNWLF